MLARLLADRGLALVGVDADVDRLPPDRVAAGVGDRGEHRLARRGDLPLVDEHVLARGETQQRRGHRLLDTVRRLCGVALGAEVANDRGAVDRPWIAPAVELDRRHAREEGLDRPGRPELDANAAGAVTAGELAVRRAGRHLHHVSGPEHVLAAVEDQAHRALDHLVALGLDRVQMLLGEQAPRAADDVELQQLAGGVGGGLANLDPDSRGGDVQHGFGRGHVALCAARARSDHRVSGLIVRPFAESSISVASRRSRVSARLALNDPVQCGAPVRRRLTLEPLPGALRGAEPALLLVLQLGRFAPLERVHGGALGVPPPERRDARRHHPPFLDQLLRALRCSPRSRYCAACAA